MLRLIEKLHGQGDLITPDGVIRVEYVVRTFQEFNDGVAGLFSASGGIVLPSLDGKLGNVAALMQARTAVFLRLADGRTAPLIFTDAKDGDFKVAGAII